MIPLIFVLIFDETFEPRKLSHNAIMHSSSQ